MVDYSKNWLQKGIEKYKDDPEFIKEGLELEKAEQLARAKKRILPCELYKKGGKWLGAARTWLQWNTKNGDRVTWGSNDVIEPHLTVKQIEDLAAHVAAAAINEINEIFK